MIAKNQLFQFNCQLYEQIDGVAMGSPLAPLMANSFLCHIDENLDQANKLPSLYKRYDDDTLALVDNIDDAESFLHVVNEAHPSQEFTKELAVENRIPFLALLNTTLYRGLWISSTWEIFHKEVERQKEIFKKLQYPIALFHSTVQRVIQEKQQQQQQQHQQQQQTKLQQSDDDKVVRFSLPFKDQFSCENVKKQLRQLNRKIKVQIEPVFTTRKLGTNFGLKEEKHPLVSRQNVVYFFQCDLCEAGYVGYTC
ncbi:uncharacterized protein [Montipora capricornis]|uniref:uncharacterized protein n=1 Tax=Montipora capricornis TaxID=246305 RepID=UPI0035F14628